MYYNVKDSVEELIQTIYGCRAKKQLLFWQYICELTNSFCIIFFLLFDLILTVVFRKKKSSS